MSFRTRWHTLLDECDVLGDATLTTPQTDKTFRITSVQEPRIVIEFVDTSESQPLQREQFETLAGRITDAGGTFELQRLPPDAEPYAAVLSLHPCYECNERADTLTETDDPTSSQLITGTSAPYRRPTTGPNRTGSRCLRRYAIIDRCARTAESVDARSV